MKTLTVTELRPKVGAWLDRALKGEDIGVAWRGQIVALRPVAVYSEDYALIEYTLTGPQLKRAVKKLNRRARRKGKAWDGTLKGLRG